jgi:hypothetical protein
MIGRQQCQDLKMVAEAFPSAIGVGAAPPEASAAGRFVRCNFGGGFRLKKQPLKQHRFFPLSKHRS